MNDSVLTSQSDSSSTFFLPYQRRWILDTSIRKLMQKGRQIGLSWSTAYGLVRRISQADARQDAWVSSRDELQARLFIQDCLAFAKLLNLASQDLGEKVIDDKGNTAFVLAFANGKRIHSLSSNPDAQAGKRGSRCLDEFALHPDPRQLYNIASPGVTWGGSIEIISTHRGSFNFFNELVREIKEKGNPKNVSLHTVTLQDALNQGFLAKLKAKLPPEDERQGMDDAAYFDFVRGGCADEESFLQEYMCVPADDASAFLSYDLIASCEYRGPEADGWDYSTLAALAQCGLPLYVGVDVGRQHDLTVIWVVAKAGDVSFTRRIVELKAQTFDAQEAALYPILGLPNMRRCCIDNTGIGRQFAERAQKRFGEYRVEPVNFTGPVKEELAYPVRAAFEDRTVRVPERKEIRADLRAVKKETTASGNIRFTADRGANGHSDRFWALALALHAGKTVTAPFAVDVLEETETDRLGGVMTPGGRVL